MPINLKNYLRLMFMPGTDLFTRRRVRLCRHWLKGSRYVLDAGSGNGWFSYLAYRWGATVTAINISREQVEKACDFYNLWLKIPPARLKFNHSNIYDIEQMGVMFDEIICYETLEHIKDDVKVCNLFWKVLKPTGMLHLCCPNALHPRWQNEVLDIQEKGGHVRSGYTLDSYRTLLEPMGFKILHAEGMGGAVLTNTWLFIQNIRQYLGNIFCLPFVFLALPLAWFDSAAIDSSYSIYVKAVKPASSGR